MSGSRFLRKNRGWIAAAALVTVAGGAFLVFRNSSQAEATVSYQTETAAVGTISVTVSGTGNLEVDNTTDVYPAVTGTVAEVMVAEGSVVATGDVLFMLDERAAETNTAQALASLRQAEQSVTQTQLSVTKAQNNLVALKTKSTESSSTVAAGDIEAAEGEVSLAKAQLASAQAQKTTASEAYDEAVAAEDDLTVLAPCSGQVYELGVSAGDSVSTSGGSSLGTSGADGATTATASATSGAPVVLAPEQPLAVHLTVNEVDLPSLAVGQRADIEFDAYSDLAATGKVYEIASEGSNSSGVVTFDVWISLDVADAGLRAGMSAAATIVTDVARNTLVVSNSAVQSDGDGGYYVLVMADGATTPSQQAVEIGLASDTQTQILSGLSEGDEVVTQTIDSSDDSESTSGQGGLFNMGAGTGRTMGAAPAGPMGGQ